MDFCIRPRAFPHPDPVTCRTAFRRLPCMALSMPPRDAKQTLRTRSRESATEVYPSVRCDRTLANGPVGDPLSSTVVPDSYAISCDFA